MQSAFALSSTSATFFISSTPTSSKHLLLPNAPRFTSTRTNALCFNYNSTFSVFPMEACETIGGDACAAHMYPEVKPQTEAKKPRIGMEPFERDYLDYADPRTVLLGDACDVLGGEFCEQKH